jgi:hypothetical protein
VHTGIFILCAILIVAPTKTIGGAAVLDEVAAIGGSAVLDEVAAIGGAAVLDEIAAIGGSAVLNEVAAIGGAAVLDEIALNTGDAFESIPNRNATTIKTSANTTDANTTSTNNPPPGNPSANDIPLVIYESDAIEIELSFAHRDQITVPFPMQSYSPYNNTLYMQYMWDDNHIVGINLNTLEVHTRDFPPLPAEVDRWQAAPGSTDIYFWDRAVGRVFRLPEDGPIERIDNSFQHRNQYGHRGWMDMQGRIYAFGGYGLFTLKSMVTRFSASSGEWFQLQVEDESEMPAPQHGKHIIPDLPRRQVYLLGLDQLQGDAPRYPMILDEPDTGVWRFNYALARWNYLGPFPWRVTNARNLVDTMHSGGQFMLLPVLRTNTLRDLVIWFPDTGTHVFLSDLDVRISDFDNLMTLFWSEADQAFYLSHMQRAMNTRSIKLILHRITIPDVDAFVAAFGAAPVTRAEVTANFRYRPSLYFAVGLVLMVGFIWLIGRMLQGGKTEAAGTGVGTSTVPYSTGKENPRGAPQPAIGNHGAPGAASTASPPNGHPETKHTTQSESTPETTHPLTLTTEAGGKVLVLTSASGRRTEVLNSQENTMLGLLYSDYLADPLRYTSNEDIDSALLPGHPSPDYVRRARNLTLSRLLELLARAADQSVDEDFILQRKSNSDKRKTEFRLNGNLIHVELPADKDA